MRSTSNGSPAVRCVIRRARPGERIRTLDGTDRALEPDMLVIADGEHASAVGGVMGGHDSEIGPHDAAHRPRERLLSSAVDPPHEQAARAEDGGVDPLRARRRHRGPAARHRPRGGPLRRRSAPARRGARSSIAIRRRGRSRRCGCDRRASRGSSARPCPPTMSRGSWPDSASASRLPPPLKMAGPLGW